jgi:muramoyltetrapeptide carboxypeptidase LdcA involved in peptidoglycan recycling
MTHELLTRIVADKPELAHLPVIANVDFGHTTPTATFPIGGTAQLRARRSEPLLGVVRH